MRPSNDVRMPTQRNCGHASNRTRAPLVPRDTPVHPPSNLEQWFSLALRGNTARSSR